MNRIRSLVIIISAVLIAMLSPVTVCANTSVSTGYLSNNNESNGNTLILPADNKYFPNMTLTEIKKWYLDECSKFVATGKKSVGNQWYDVEYFKSCVKMYSEDSFKKKDKFMRSTYMTMVDGYNKADTQEFYQVQKKLYDFIKDYHANNEYMLNFSNWDKVNQLQEETKIQETQGNQETDSVVESSKVQGAGTEEYKDDKPKNNTPIYIIVIIIIVIALVIGIVIRIKSKRN